MSHRPDETDRTILHAMQRAGGATVADVCEVTGSTATAARYRLNRLIDGGLVDRSPVPSGRGRPHHVYEVTPAGLRELGENYAELAMLLWRAVRGIEEPELKAAVLDRVRQSMVSSYGGDETMRPDEPTAARFDRLASRLGASGFDIEVDRTGELPILRENNCPYHELATEDSDICELEQSVFAEVLGTEIVRSQCCLDGDGCCEFTPVPTNANH